MNSTFPFELPLTQQAFEESAYGVGTPRRLSEMKDCFADLQAAEAILKTDDPIMYDFRALRTIEDRQKLIFGLTTLYAGTVGDEYYMTKGHFHAEKQDGDEIYLVIQGSGHLLLQAQDGSPQTIAMRPGSLYYTPATWAHRTVNSGDQDLVFLSVWAADVDYDYETIIQRGGFPQRIVKGSNGPLIVENARFHLD